MTTSLLATGITTRLGHKTVLSNMSLPELQSGQLCALLGPNGSGKSTLLKSLAGLVDSRMESLTYGGKTLKSENRNQQIETLFGYLPQHLPEGPNLTVVEALRVALESAKTHSKHSWFERVTLTLEQLNLSSLAYARADRLSGGQKQLLALGQLLCREPRILLLDEPFSALDMAHTYAVMALLKKLTAQKQLITIFVTHDLNFALSNADRAMLMHNGQIIASGAPGSIFDSTQIAAVFGVHTRIEHCSQGKPFILVDGPVNNPLLSIHQNANPDQ